MKSSDSQNPGRTPGRKRKLSAVEVKNMLDVYNDPETGKTVSEIAEDFGITKPTLYAYIEREKATA